MNDARAVDGSGLPGSDAVLREIFEASPDAVILVGQDGVIEDASPAVERLFGYRPAELRGRPIEVLIPGDRGGAHVRHRDRYMKAPEGRPMGVGLDLKGLHRDGSVFPVDVSLAPTTAGGRLRVGAFVRDATERRRGEDLLRFVNEISRGVIAGEPTHDLLVTTAGRARQLVGAAVAWIAVQTRDGAHMEVAAAAGDAADALEGALVPVEGSLAARAMRSASTLSIPDMGLEPEVLAEARSAGFGCGMYLPMLAERGPVGTLVLARRVGHAPFDAGEVTAAEVFASAAALVLALGEARHAVEELRMTVEHERIARDLHDTVIQRLFGLGMRLQAAERLTDGPVAERIRDTVDAMDGVIREIRETIFDLNRPEGPGDPHSLRSRLRAVVSEVSDGGELSPRLGLRGPVEVAVPDAMAPHLLAVVREALSNVMRHAGASAVDVVLSVAEGKLTLSVADDGVGISADHSAGNGLANMAARAAELGGAMSVSRRSPSGTLLQWSVPLAPPAEPASSS